MRIKNKSKFEKICRKAIFFDFYYYVLKNKPTIDEAAEYYGVSKGYISRLVIEMKPLITRFKNKLQAKVVEVQELERIVNELAEKPLYEAGRKKNVEDEGV